MLESNGGAQLLVVCGKGSYRTLRLLRAGVDVESEVSVDLPEQALDVFSLRASVQVMHDRYLVVAFSLSTMVLAISNLVVNQVIESGIMNYVHTFLVQLMDDDSFVQVVHRGIHHVFREQRGCCWSAPSSCNVERVSCNGMQLLLGLKNGVVVYFELDKHLHHLKEIGFKDFDVAITSIDILRYVDRSKGSRIFAFSTNCSRILVVSLAGGNLLETLHEARVERTYVASLAFGSFFSPVSGFFRPVNIFFRDGIFLYAGLFNGVLLRYKVEKVDFRLSCLSYRFVGGGVFRVS